MSNNDQPRRYLTTEEAAAHCRLSPRTLEKFRCVGGGPRYLKRGRRVLYPPLDLAEWMTAEVRCSPSSAQPVTAA